MVNYCSYKWKLFILFLIKRKKKFFRFFLNYFNLIFNKDMMQNLNRTEQPITKISPKRKLNRLPTYIINYYLTLSKEIQASKKIHSGKNLEDIKKLKKIPTALRRKLLKITKTNSNLDEFFKIIDFTIEIQEISEWKLNLTHKLFQEFKERLKNWNWELNSTYFMQLAFESCLLIITKLVEDSTPNIEELVEDLECDIHELLTFELLILEVIEFGFSTLLLL